MKLTRIKNKFKVILLGEGFVGKSSIISRYSKGDFLQTQQVTIQAAYVEKSIQVGSETITLIIWDTAGQEKFHCITPLYYRGSDASIIVYDITDRKSYDRMKNWYNELIHEFQDNIIIFILGNKSDLESARCVSADEVKAFCLQNKVSYFETSAKNNVGIKEAFEQLARCLFDYRREMNMSISHIEETIPIDDSSNFQSRCC